ncbi:MAG: hypothetical protein IKW90_15635 [Lachnospiraceae bacterium]|nr:hypothetical protein [Lachnospiraceae bacterium]
MGHTEREIQIMKEYIESTDTDVRDFVDSVLSGKDKLNYVTVAFISTKAAKRIYELTGKTTYGNRVILDISAVKHIEKRHGSEGNQDHSMSNPDDIARIGYVIMNFDEISWDGETSLNHIDENGKPAPKIQFSKKIDGTIYVVQTVSACKSKKNYIVTAYIKKKQTSNP